MRPLVPLVLLSLLATPLVADSDLNLFTWNSSESIRAGQSFSAVFGLENLGRDQSTPITATIDIPPDLELVGVSNLHACEGTRPMRCHVDSIPIGWRTSLQLHFRAPLADRTYEIRASVAADNDRNPSNNTAVKIAHVSTAPDLIVDLPNASDGRRVDPGEAFSVFTYASNGNLPQFSAKNVTLHFDVENATIESAGTNGWRCEWSETAAECFASEVPAGSQVELKLRASNARDGRSVRIRARISSAATEFDPENNSDAYDVAIYRWIAVTNTADDGEGSLRDAIDDANRLCSPGPCRIVFEIPDPVPTEGWFTIRPQSPLPALDADRVIVSATTQTTFTGDTNPAGPEIFLDGSDAGPGDGLHATLGCAFGVQGLAVGNFRGYGLRLATRMNTPCSQAGYDQRLVLDNDLGTDPTGAHAAPNMRGLLSGSHFVVFARNVISGNERGGVWESGTYNIFGGNRIGVAADGTTPLPNGASGVFVTPRSFQAQVVGNVISYNAHVGVAITRGSTAAVHRNSMRDNGGLGIDIGLDGRAAPAGAPDIPAPVLLSARYDASTDSTIVSGRIYAKPSFLLSFTVGVYANDDPDGDGETYLGEIEPKRDEDTFTFTAKGDQRGKWINAAVTRVDWIVFANEEPSAQWFEPSNKSTSELSTAVLVTE